MAMYLQGENHLEDLRKNQQKAALDEDLRDELLRKGDYDALIDDSQTSLLTPIENGDQQDEVESTEAPPPTPES